MFNLSYVLNMIERRARRLHGLHVAGFTLCAGGIADLVIVGAHRLGILPLGSCIPYVVLGLSLLGTGFAYLLGRRGEVNLPRLVLRIDLALETQERLSSLYELRRRGGGEAFRRRIETELKEEPPQWKKGFPARLGPLMAGGLTLVVAFLLIALVPAPSLEHTEKPPVEASVTEEQRSRPTVSEPSQRAVGVREPSPDSSPPAAAEKTSSYGLEDDLTKIWEPPASAGALIEQNVDLTEMLERQRNLSSSLSELLSRIEEGLQQGRTALTEEEHRALSQLLPQVADPRMRQALERLIQEEDPAALEEYLKRALSLTQRLISSEESSSEERSREEASPPEEGEGDHTFPWEGAEAGGEKSDSAATGQRPGAEGSETTSEQTKPGMEEGRFGGVEGTEGEIGPVGQAPGFIPVELEGMIGSTGEFQPFLTKGVPLESRSKLRGEAGRFFVDYEALRALLEGRTIPHEAQDSVRKYFQAITQGGS